MFVDAIKSPATKTVYINSLKRHMSRLRLTKADELLIHLEPRLINAQLIDDIISLRQDGLSYYCIKFLVAPFLRSTLEMMSNRKKVFEYLGEYKCVAKDKTKFMHK